MATPHGWPWNSNPLDDAYGELQRHRALLEREAHAMMQQARLGLNQYAPADNTAELKACGSLAAAGVQSKPAPNPVLILCPLS